MLLLQEPEHASPVHLVTDIFGAWGVGGWSGSQWFQVRWTESAQQQPIAAKELIPIVVAVAACMGPGLDPQTHTLIPGP